MGTDDPTNWRPIAVLRVIYKLLSRMVSNRILPTLDCSQTADQCGFRPGFRIDDALTSVELLPQKTGEWNIPVWMASLDLKKAFDRTPHAPLLDALAQQGLDPGYVSLIAALYNGQTAKVNGSRAFSIQRGVRQGDVLSSLLFNAGVESAMRKWKQRLPDGAGIQFSPGAERLTNVSHADDKLIVATLLDELPSMIATLVKHFEAVGLELSYKKCVILSNLDARCGAEAARFARLGGKRVRIRILPCDLARKSPTA